MPGNTSEIARELGVTARRVRQLIELGVLIADDDGTIDPDRARSRYDTFVRRDEHEVRRLVSRLESLANEACAAAERLSAKSSLFAARRVADLAKEFDELGALVEAMRPESERALLGHARKTIVGGLLADAIEVARAHQRRAAEPAV